MIQSNLNSIYGELIQRIEKVDIIDFFKSTIDRQTDPKNIWLTFPRPITKMISTLFIHSLQKDDPQKIKTQYQIIKNFYLRFRLINKNVRTQIDQVLYQLIEPLMKCDPLFVYRLHAIEAAKINDPVFNPMGAKIPNMFKNIAFLLDDAPIHVISSLFQCALHQKSKPFSWLRAIYIYNKFVKEICDVKKHPNYHDCLEEVRLFITKNLLQRKELKPMSTEIYLDRIILAMSCKNIELCKKTINEYRIDDIYSKNDLPKITLIANLALVTKQNELIDLFIDHLYTPECLLKHIGTTTLTSMTGLETIELYTNEYFENPEQYKIEQNSRKMQQQFIKRLSEKKNKNWLIYLFTHGVSELISIVKPSELVVILWNCSHINLTKKISEQCNEYYTKFEEHKEFIQAIQLNLEQTNLKTTHTFFNQLTLNTLKTLIKKKMFFKITPTEVEFFTHAFYIPCLNQDIQSKDTEALDRLCHYLFLTLKTSSNLLEDYNTITEHLKKRMQNYSSGKRFEGLRYCLSNLEAKCKWFNIL